MSKRLAETQMTPEELASKLNEEGQQAEHSQNNKATEEELQGRKIIKVKRYLKNDQVVTEPGQGTFKLVGTLNTQPAESKPLNFIPQPTKMFKPIEQTVLFGGQKINLAETQ